MYVYMYACLYTFMVVACTSAILCVFLTICLSVAATAWPTVCLYVYQSVYLSNCHL